MRTAKFKVVAGKAKHQHAALARHALANLYLSTAPYIFSLVRATTPAPSFWLPCLHRDSVQTSTSFSRHFHHNAFIGRHSPRYSTCRSSKEACGRTSRMRSSKPQSPNMVSTSGHACHHCWPERHPSSARQDGMSGWTRASRRLNGAKRRMKSYCISPS